MQNITTGPCQPRREAGKQSVELKEYILSHVHEVSQPNWGTPNVALHRALKPSKNSGTK